VAFPDGDTADKVADYIGEKVAFDATGGNVPLEVTLKIANAAIEASQYMAAQPGFKAASFLKVASIDDLAKLAHAHALDVMQKAAEGSNYEGGDKGNSTPESAEGKMDASQRPAGYAENSRGKTDVDTRPGAVGKEQEQPNKPGESPAGSNSVTEQSRTASLAAMIKKVAQGSNIMGGDKGNMEMSSAEAKMDASQRPAGYAVLPSQGSLGELMNQVKGPAVIGRETAHPNGPGESPSGSNSVTQQSAKAASEDPYVTVFKKTAAEVAPYLPSGLSDDVKVAHVRACMGLTTEEKAHYLTGLQKEAADKTAATKTAAAVGTGRNRPGAYDGRNANQVTKEAEMPDFIREKIEAKKDGEGGEKKEEASESKKDEKAEDKDEKKDEKEASLADHFRRINAAIQTRS
jgi:hypothetical protein